MGDLFDSGPSAGDIRRAEEAAFEKEAARLRLQEQKMRQRKSKETMQGEGVATPGDVTLGTDTIDNAKPDGPPTSLSRAAARIINELGYMSEADRWAAGAGEREQAEYEQAVAEERATAEQVNNAIDFRRGMGSNPALSLLGGF